MTVATKSHHNYCRDRRPLRKYLLLLSPALALQIVLSSLSTVGVVFLFMNTIDLNSENSDRCNSRHQGHYHFTSSFSPLSVTVRDNDNKIIRNGNLNNNDLNYNYHVISTKLTAINDVQLQQQQKKRRREKKNHTKINPILGAPICMYHQVEIPTSEKNNPVPRQEIFVEDLTSILNTLVEESGMKHGLLTVISRHTTTSLTINELESRLTHDIAKTLLDLIPPDERSMSPASRKGVTYQHNDIHLRPFGVDDDDDDDGNNNINSNKDSEEAQRCRENNWDVDDPVQLQAWRDQEPINSHSHLLSIMAGSSSESIPVYNSQMVLGTWQSVLLLDLDGPRNRTVGVQLMGYL